MTNQQVALILAQLTATWRVRFNEANSQIWGKHLARFDFDDVTEAIAQLAETNPNLPAIADIIAKTRAQQPDQPQAIAPERNQDLNRWGWKVASNIRREVTAQRRLGPLTDTQVHAIVTRERQRPKVTESA